MLQSEHHSIHSHKQHTHVQCRQQLTVCLFIFGQTNVSLTLCCLTHEERNDHQDMTQLQVHERALQADISEHVRILTIKALLTVVITNGQQDRHRQLTRQTIRSKLTKHTVAFDTANHHSPVQLTPSPVYPAMHAQVKLPAVLVHVEPVAAQLSVFSEHSSSSVTAVRAPLLFL